MTTRSYRTDPTLSRRRDAIRAFWAANPATPAREVAARFNVSESTALDAKPYHLRSIRPRTMQWRKLERNAVALRLAGEGATPEEIAEATGRSITTTRRFLRSHTKANP